jgi:hypothetical protein
MGPGCAGVMLLARRGSSAASGRSPAGKASPLPCGRKLEAAHLHRARRMGGNPSRMNGNFVGSFCFPNWIALLVEPHVYRKN